MTVKRTVEEDIPGQTETDFAHLYPQQSTSNICGRMDNVGHGGLFRHSPVLKQEGSIREQLPSRPGPVRHGGTQAAPLCQATCNRLQQSF